MRRQTWKWPLSLVGLAALGGALASTPFGGVQEVDLIGAATGKVVTCPPDTGGVSGTCYAITISCPGVADTTATLKVTDPPGQAIGTIMFGTDDGGNTFYDTRFTFGSTIIQQVANAGYHAVQIAFNDPSAPVGWLTGPGGPRPLACRYSTALQWIYSNIHLAGTSSAFCATGQSGGSGAIGFALSRYGMGSILDMVEPTGGPVFSRVDHGCICQQPKLFQTCGSLQDTDCYTMQDAVGFLDPAFGSNICSQALLTGNTTNQALFLENSMIGTSDAILQFPLTDVHVVLGGLDGSPGYAQSMDWTSVITGINGTPVVPVCLPRDSHEIPNFPDGAAQIVSDLTAYCVPHHQTPSVSLTSSTVSFGNQLVASSSPPEAVALSNTGTGALSIASITITGANSGDFAQTNTCGASVAAGASCTISVTFTPSATGTRTGALTINDNAKDSPQTASLTGTGVVVVVSLSASSLSFGSQLVGTSSAAQAISLSNTGSTALTIGSIGISGEFAQTNTCGASVAAGASCAIDVTFTPTATGTRTGTLTVNDNASGSPQTVALTGTGVAPAVTLSASSLSFGSQLVTTTSGARAVTLTNTGTDELSMIGITITGTNSGDFTQTNSCAASVAAGASCTINVTFTPTAVGPRSGTLTINDNASGSP